MKYLKRVLDLFADREVAPVSDPEHIAHLQRIVDGLVEEADRAWQAYEAACDELAVAQTELEEAQGVWEA